MQHGVFCYAYISDAKTWAEAQTVCKALGGYLAEIQSKAENDYILKIMSEHRGAAWLGAHDLITEGKWFWATSRKPVSDFTFWKPGEPNNFEGREDCMQIDGGTWNDQDCGDHSPSICQTPIEPIVVG